MRERAYEVTERATVYRTYIVFASTGVEAKRKVLAGENTSHPGNDYSDASNERIVRTRRAPAYDEVAGDET